MGSNCLIGMEFSFGMMKCLELDLGGDCTTMVSV